MKTIIAEKPSVAREIARIVGATKREEGVFELDALYTVPEAVASSTGAVKKAPQKAITTGKQKVKQGTPNDASAVIYELIPSDGEPVIYFLVEGDNLTLMNDALQKAAADLNYTLRLVQ